MDNPTSNTAAATRDLLAAIKATGASGLIREHITDPDATPAEAPERPPQDTAEIMLSFLPLSADLSGSFDDASRAVEAMDINALYELLWILADQRSRAGYLYSIVSAAVHRREESLAAPHDTPDLSAM